MKITGIRIRITSSYGTPMKAVATVTLDDVLVIHDVKVICTQDKEFVVMPSRKNADGTFRDVVHPITPEFRSELETEVFKAYREEIERIASELDTLKFDPNENED